MKMFTKAQISRSNKQVSQYAAKLSTKLLINKIINEKVYT